MCIIAPSLLEADYKCLGEQLKTMEKSGAEYVHIDVMDGSFVPNLACGMKMIHGLKGVADLVFDVHLMVNEPVRFVKRMQEAGADVISVHYEQELSARIRRWEKNTGMQAMWNSCRNCSESGNLGRSSYRRNLEACRCDTGYDRSSGKRWPALY